MNFLRLFFLPVLETYLNAVDGKIFVSVVVSLCVNNFVVRA